MKKILLIVMSLLLLSCSQDDDTTQTAKNEMSYDGEDTAITVLEILQQGNNLILTGANDDNQGFIIEFRDKTLETLDGTYTFNNDEEGYNPVTDFSGATLINSTGYHNVTSGQVTVDDIDGTNITLSFNVNADGIPATGVHVGVYED